MSTPSATSGGFVHETLWSAFGELPHYWWAVVGLTLVGCWLVGRQLRFGRGSWLVVWTIFVQLAVVAYWIHSSLSGYLLQVTVLGWGWSFWRVVRPLLPEQPVHPQTDETGKASRDKRSAARGARLEQGRPGKP